MSKKTLCNKSNKAMSKIKSNDKQRQNQSCKLAKDCDWKCEIARLELIIQKEIRHRESNEKKIIEQLRYLQQTKKSKLSSQPDIAFFNKILSPSKKQKRVEIQQITECKNLLSTIKSSTEIELANNNVKFKQLQKQMANIYHQKNVFESFQTNFQLLSKQFANFYRKFQTQYGTLKKQIDCIKQNMGKVPQKVYSSLKLWLGEQMKKQNEVQRNYIWNIQKQVMKKVDLIQNCAQTSIYALNSLQKQAHIIFQNLENKVKSAHQSVSQTKETIEQIYGSKDKMDSLSSFDFPTQLVFPKRNSQTVDKLNLLDSKMMGLQRRMDLIYDQYLSRPLHRFTERLKEKEYQI